jgi:neutral ceramidase
MLGAAQLLACQGPEMRLTPALSPDPRPVPSDSLMAGFGRADITPPPGIGLTGNGPEGRKAAGYRLRLYARALVLQEPSGRRLALVVADLPHVSALLHRRVAELLLRDGTGIGTDRLLLSATHTHAGPGHHYEAGAYNASASEVSGYDAVLADSLVHRIARAVRVATEDLRNARMAWGTTHVWGISRVRSLPARERNLPRPAVIGTPPPGLPPALAAIDPRLTLLRVDLWDPAAAEYRPAGAFSVFAVHGTGNATENDLLDADIHGLVERGLERHIDARNHAGQGFRPRAVHLFANGSEGDISPSVPASSRCDLPRLAPHRAVGGPFAERRWGWHRAAPNHVRDCVGAARRATVLVGDSLAAAAIALFDRLAPARGQPLLRRAYTTLDLAERAESLGVCETPFNGTSTAGGAPDARTRVYRWRLFGLFSAGFEEGGTAVNREHDGCHGAKRILLGPGLQSLLVSPDLPGYAQVSVFRVGSVLLVGIPAEVTTEAAQRIERAVLAAAPRNEGIKEARVISLANGFLQYLTTAEEYSAQFYEGGSTLYGPGSAALMARTAGALAARLDESGVTMPGVTIVGHPGDDESIIPRPGRVADSTESDRLEGVECRGDTLLAHWVHGVPGQWLEEARPQIEIREDVSDTLVAWDDHPWVEVRAVGRRGHRVRWEARWVPPRHAGYRVVLPGASDSLARADAVRCGPRISGSAL